MSDIYCGLSAREVRMFSFECAAALNIMVPQGWRDRKMAGTDSLPSSWKHIRLFIWTNLRKQASVELQILTLLLLMLFFFLVIWKKNLTVCELGREACGTWTQHVKQPCRYLIEILPAAYIQIGRLVSTVRGKYVTLALAISATRKTVQSFFVFSGLHFRAHFFKEWFSCK